MPLIKVLRNGQVTLPKEYRDVLGVKEGDVLEAEIEDSTLVLKPKVLVDKNEAWAKLSHVMDKVGKRHQNISEEEVEKDVLEALKTARSQKHAH
ncbi:MAG: AbrB/MazE/SpoVT family DNA-binding domain-containing protein [Candidatus Tectomicrobia bacterium]|uniref:AbrB/MazE/SpoVT family DNA-binding domain-containing protein n=1 Tax=Tectimicrobiota bacterium TaxID=2528274 RepID=A0A933LPH5_UNCTE|nr:AbrB/MazE/SpoVT family DNA-binding domain-containing protein [Candidatus Tectomicrobia bacterium]